MLMSSGISTLVQVVDPSSQLSDVVVTRVLCIRIDGHLSPQMVREK